ncbi:putative aldouronate transport system substrate-binding protein [Paenibacillus endophyticus]|uniref:Putative aldouronate transport system substrate-binding protein n=1 Tax=Paenibacillus endophyticus TaxID=1294268 RepID=A0A7W5GDG0_9BACL|nr:extracellular solute-binding protein [Paenibacillus endophyticus]MBB3155906.1 putative aldouronate transport system substrate-binding protein [Paenibacillus endophyticus]
MKNKSWSKSLLLMLAAMIVLTACTGKSSSDSTSNSGNSGTPLDKPATWIADRKVKGLVFMGSDVDEAMNPEIQAKLKAMTGIELTLQAIGHDDSTKALAAGLVAGDLPDFIGYYLNHSGRPEMEIINKAAREDMFHDLAPYLKNTKIYSKYFEKGYLPMDTEYGVMFRPEYNGSAYSVHINIPREGGYSVRKYISGPYIRKDIADALGVDPRTITTSSQLYELAKKIKEGHFKDNNGKEVSPIGPIIWGGGDRASLYNDLVWTGYNGEGFKHDAATGKIMHESQTDYGLKRVEFVQKLLKEGLMQLEYYTMEETRAKEGMLNNSFAIIGEMHNYVDENKDGRYIPVGPLNSVDGPYKMELLFKSGYGGWSVPKTTKNPEDIVKLADFLATREGKLLWMYGIEGRDYDLDDKGNPVPKKEVMDLLEKDPAKAKKLGFGGVGNDWGWYLGGTDKNDLVDFGEATYGSSLAPDKDKVALSIADYWGYDEKNKNADVKDGYAALAFIGEFGKGLQLTMALDKYKESMIRAYYAKDMDEAKTILDAAAKQLQAAGLEEYIKLLEAKDKNPQTKLQF